MQQLRNDILNILILVLVAIILLQKCKETPAVSKVSIVRDTVWVHHDSTIYSRPQLIKTIPIESTDSLIKYLPDTNYSKLVLQYQDVVNQLLAKNIEQDSVIIDTIGYLKILDTVQHNRIKGRSILYDIKSYKIREIITVPAKKVNQLYIGGVIQGTPEISQIGASLLLKTRKDFIIGGSLSVNTYGDPQYGIGAYWKINLKK